MFAALPQQVHIIEEAPEVQLRGGLFYVVDRTEGVVIVRVFRPSTFFKTIATFAEESRNYRVAGAEVIPFPERLGAS